MTDQRSIRVLLIEDNPGDARLVRELLTEEGDQFGTPSPDRCGKRATS
jgi:CheY-like chemotaxis protein